MENNNSLLENNVNTNEVLDDTDAQSVEPGNHSSEKTECLGDVALFDIDKRDNHAEFFRCFFQVKEGLNSGKETKKLGSTKSK